jgi:TRAP-type C4-dicarboxylate transport system substrate-binding protein
MRNITTTNRPVRAPADLKGLILRVPPNEVMLDTFKALGADARSYPIAELYQALAAGTFDAEENPISIIVGRHYDQVQRYLSLTGHIYSAAVFMMSKAVFDLYGPDDQRLLRSAAPLSMNPSAALSPNCAATA